MYGLRQIAGATLLLLLATVTALATTIRFSDAPSGSPSFRVALVSATNASKAHLDDESILPHKVPLLIDQLRKQRTEVSRQLNQFGDDAYSRDQGPTPDKPAIQDARQMLERSDRSRISEYLQISQQLDKLESILMQRRQAATATEPPNPPTTVPTPPEPDTVDENESSEDASDDVDIPKSPLPVLEGAVDSLQLADNLFGAGQYETALNICQNIDRKKLDDYENSWLHYQIASCQRKLGAIPQAEKHYRVVAGHAGSEHLSDYARWWLDSIDTVKTFQRSLNQLNSSIESVRQDL